MADDRLPLRSIDITRSDNVRFRRIAISLNACQKALSRLTLVLCPPTVIGRLTTSELRILVKPIGRRDKWPPSVGQIVSFHRPGTLETRARRIVATSCE